MNELLLALTVFLALHSLPALPAVRSRLTATLGVRLYLSIYSLVSSAVLIWVIYAALNTEYVHIWMPHAWHAVVALIISPVALFLVIAGLISPNPTSVSFRTQGRPGAITAVTRHPVLWGFTLWSGGHVLVNGDLRSLILFGGLGLFSIAGIFVAERRAKRRLIDEWPRIVSTTSILPMAAITSGKAGLRADVALIVALVISIVTTAWLLTGGHAILFAADPLSALRYG